MTKTVKQLLACGMALTILSTGAATTAVTVNNVGQSEIVAHAAAANYTPDQGLSDKTIDPIKDQLDGADLKFDSGSYLVNGGKTDIDDVPAGARNDPQSKGRATGGSARVDSSTLAAASRSGVAKKTPVGWYNIHIGGADYLFNRGHLLGYKIIGGVQGFDNSEDNMSNVVAETEWANQANEPTSKGQLFYEMQIINAAESGKTIMYQVKALYNGDEAIPRAIWLQARSTDGSLNINALIPNAMKGYNINWGHVKDNGGGDNGQNQADSSSQDTPEQDQSQQPTASNQQVLPQTSGSLWSRVLSWFGLN